jgi:hypothetical protein
MGEAVKGKSLELVRDLQMALSIALGSLVGKQSSKPIDKYLFLAARHVSSCVDAYVLLRTNGRKYASRIIIRSCLEAMYRFEAVRKKPELLYQILYSEHVEDIKLIGPLSELRNDPRYRAEIDRQWEAAKLKYRQAFKPDQLIDQELSVYDAARAAGREGDYQAYYRFYCRFTHAGLRAIELDLDDLDYLDDPSMALATFVILDGLVAMGANVESFKELDRRLKELLESQDLIEQDNSKL